MLNVYPHNRLNASVSGPRKPTTYLDTTDVLTKESGHMGEPYVLPRDYYERDKGSSCQDQGYITPTQAVAGFFLGRLIGKAIKRRLQG